MFRSGSRMFGVGSSLVLACRKEVSVVSRVFEVGSSRFTLEVDNQEYVNPYVVVANYNVIDAFWIRIKRYYLA